MGCTACLEHPVVRCGRCSLTRCAKHAFVPGQRCEDCESEYAAEAPARRNVKILFAPSASILAGGLLFGLLLPISFGAIGAAIACTIVCAAGVGAGVGTCTLVDRSARAVFLRERNMLLPPARVVIR